MVPSNPSLIIFTPWAVSIETGRGHLYWNSHCIWPVTLMAKGMHACSVTKLCLMLCDLMDCSPPDSSPWNIPGKNTEVGCHFLLQGIFPTMGLNLHVLHWQTDSLPLTHLGMTDCIHGTPSLCPISMPFACDFLIPPIKWQNIFLAPWFLV